MRMKTRNAKRIMATLSALLAAPVAVNGFSYFQYGGVNVVWFGAQSFRWLSPSTFPEGSEPDIMIQESMGLWNIVPACDFTYSAARADQDYPIDNFDGFNDTAAVPASWLDPGVLGVTFLVNDGPQWYDMDVVFSDLPLGIGYTMDPNPTCDVVANPTPNNGFSFLLVAVHEMGHALGLGHDPIGDESPGTPWFIQTMNPRYPSGGPIGDQNIIELHTADRNGARFLYPHSGPSEPPYIDVATAGYTSGSVLGKAIPIYFSPASVDPSGTLNIRSVIENLGTSNVFFIQQGFYLSTDEIIDPTDFPLGSLEWDIAFEDAFEFDAEADMPDDIAAGQYYIGSILDDQNQLAELYEDNNVGFYCSPLTINRLSPEINPMGQEVISCASSYTGPTPTVTRPLNANPITWSLDNPPSGMTINPSTGVIFWPSPIRSPFQYTLIVRATNSAGSATQLFFLGVLSAPPQLVPIPNQSALCGSPFVGPTPLVVSPSCMNPIVNWSLDNGPPGMVINHSSGVVSWPSPVISAAPYSVTIRATNSEGNGTVTFQLKVKGGNLDGDNNIDVADFAGFDNCFTGQGGGLLPGCACADQDVDGDVDLRDLAAFQNNFSG